VQLSHSVATIKDRHDFPICGNYHFDEGGRYFFEKTKKIVLMGLLIALDVIAASFLTIKMTYLRIGTSFIPVSFTGLIFGPLLGGIGAGIADVVQFLLFPSGAFIPGITLDSFLSGAVYGLLLHKKRPALWRTFTAAAINQLVISGVLTTFWLYLAIPGNTFSALFITRIIKCLIMTPIETVVIYGMWQLKERTKVFSRVSL